MTQSTPTVKVDLDQATEDLWLLRNLSNGFADEPLARLAALIAELRAARAEIAKRDAVRSAQCGPGRVSQYDMQSDAYMPRPIRSKRTP